MKFKEYLQETTQPVFLTNHDEIKTWLDKMEIENYTIASDGKVSVKGNVDINSKQLTSIPVQFEEVDGDFNCSDNQLTSLTGVPTKVGGYFSCNKNKLKSLVGSPTKVGGYFACSHNKLTSLVGCPSKVGGHFACNENELTSLVGCPSNIRGGFYCRRNKLTTLVGCPSVVNSSFNCYGNELTTLVGISDLIKSINGYFIFDSSKMKSGGLGLLLIKDVMSTIIYQESKVFDIINKYIRKPDKIFECQQELIENGFEEYAQL